MNNNQFSPLSLNPIILLDPVILRLNDGVAVTSAQDSSGNGFNLLQLDPTKKVTFVNVGPAGRSALLGDGVASQLVSPELPAITEWWSLLICQAVTLSGTGSIVQFEDTAGPGAGGQHGLWADAANQVLAWATTTGTIETTIPFQAGTPYAILMQSTAADMAISNNLGQSFNVGATGALGGKQMTLFGRSGGPFFNGVVSYFVFGAGVLTPFEVAALWDWVKKEWKL